MVKLGEDEPQLHKVTSAQYHKRGACVSVQLILSDS